MTKTCPWYVIFKQIDKRTNSRTIGCTYMWQALNLVASELAVGTDGSDVVGVAVV